MASDVCESNKRATSSPQPPSIKETQRSKDQHSLAIHVGLAMLRLPSPSFNANCGSWHVWAWNKKLKSSYSTDVPNMNAVRP